MIKQKNFKILFIFPGIFLKLFEMAKEGSKDINNRLLFKNSIVESGCSISSDTIIMPNSRIFYNTSINKCKINEYTYIGSNCFLQNVSIGRFCSIAKHSLIGLGTHPINSLSTSPLFYRKKNPLKIKFLKKDLGFEEYKSIEIGHDVWIGARAIILDGVKIGTGAIVASGAVVTKDVPSYGIVGGVPAKLIKFRFSSDKITQLLNTNWWDWELEKINQYQKENFNNENYFNNI